MFIISGKNGSAKELILTSILKKISIEYFLESTKMEGEIAEQKIIGSLSFSPLIYATITKWNSTPS